MELTIYGSITNKFGIFAEATYFCNNIKNDKIKQSRLNCYYKHDLPPRILKCIAEKLKLLKLETQDKIEIFYPSQNYPPHTDEGGISYFIPLEEGTFSINGVNYPVIPFILYSFEDGNPHNSNFVSIMLK